MNLQSIFFFFFLCKSFSWIFLLIFLFVYWAISWHYSFDEKNLNSISSGTQKKCTINVLPEKKTYTRKKLSTTSPKKKRKRFKKKLLYLLQSYTRKIMSPLLSLPSLLATPPALSLFTHITDLPPRSLWASVIPSTACILGDLVSSTWKLSACLSRNKIKWDNSNIA